MSAASWSDSLMAFLCFIWPAEIFLIVAASVCSLLALEVGGLVAFRADVGEHLLGRGRIGVRDGAVAGEADGSQRGHQYNS